MVLCLFAGCGKDEEKSPNAPDVNGDGLNKNEVVSGPINPLTGEKVSEDKSDLRPYCVMINNHPDARPSVGLSQASIIYEALAEGGITRMMAVFNDVDGITVGSLRSARPYYISMAQAYDAIYIHAGGSEQAYSDIKTLGIDNMDGVRGARSGEASSYYRDQTRLRTLSTPCLPTAASLPPSARTITSSSTTAAMTTPTVSALQRMPFPSAQALRPTSPFTTLITIRPLSMTRTRNATMHL